MEYFILMEVSEIGANQIRMYGTGSEYLTKYTRDSKYFIASKDQQMFH